MKKITFTFKENGSTEVDAENYKGKACLSETEKLLATLDAKLETRKLKPEYVAQVANQNTQINQNG